jgi:riboflavin kinase
LEFTERIINDVNQILFSKFGKVWESKGLHKVIGMQQLEAAKVLVEDYDLPCTPEEFVELCVPLYKERLDTPLHSFGNCLPFTSPL